jgi:hypothetical protein
LRSVLWPFLPGVLEAPTIATWRGAKSVRNSSAIPLTGLPCLVPKMFPRHEWVGASRIMHQPKRFRGDLAVAFT